METVKGLVVCGLLVWSAMAGAQEPRLDRFAFGGCNIQRFDQSFWDNIVATQPQLWVWNGDIIYADRTPLWLREHEYNILKANPHYEALRAMMPVIGTWDDHDYGNNNSGSTNADKEESKRLLLNFLDEPVESSRWRHPGVYTSYVVGPVGARVKFILLDVRSYRADPGPEAPMLGEEQWDWLRDELTAGDFSLAFIVSGTQVLADEHTGETWGEYPRERERLLNVINWSDSPVLILSGDRHLAEITQGVLPDGRPLYDFTSSGLTHSTPYDSVNTHRVGPLYTEKNFGVVEIDWEQWPLQVRMQVWDVSGTFIHEQVVELGAASR